MRAGKAKKEGSALMRDDDRRFHRQVACCVTVLVVAVMLSLLIGENDYRIHTPGDVVSAFATWVDVTVQSIFSNAHYTSFDILERCPAFYQVGGRFWITLISLLCGGVLALSGSLFQMTFRNPIAAPTMLGVSNGINIGNVLLVLIYGSAALYMPAQHLAYCYLCGIGMLLLVFGVAKLISGRGALSLTDLLLTGTILSALVGQIVTLVTYSSFDESTWYTFTCLSEVLSVNIEAVSLVAIGIACVLCTVPLFINRFRMNTLGFADDEVRLMGVNPRLLKFAALALGTIMIIAVQVQCGSVAMFALIVPFVARGTFGTTFGKQMMGDILIGSILLVIVRDLSALSMIWFNDAGLQLMIPVGAIANIFAVPLAVWIIARKQLEWR